ncbi:MAG: 4Fe-4S dicluster domain-containing protein [Elusimicrobia bacterium]|nr:4Fe-4S dicluster domain-containing protein [Elusimicrobiota bacterium]
MIKNKTFPGGYKFVKYEGQPEGMAEKFIVPPEVLIPLQQGFGNEVIPLVKIGELVKAGQIIGIDNNTVSSPIHSSVNGVVEEIKKQNYFKREVTFVRIISDRTDGIERLDGYNSDWSKLEKSKIEELLYFSGVSSLDREGMPTMYKSSIISSEEVESIIVHGVGSEPHNLSLTVLLGGKEILHFVEGLRILKTIMPKAKVHVALSRYKKKLIEEIMKLTASYDWIEIHLLEPKYPQGYDEVLIPTILRKKFPYGYSAASIGVVVLNIQAVLQAYHAVAEGYPLIERTIALCGSGWKENTHIKVRVGTPLKYIIAEYLKKDREYRIILNSLLTGVVLNDFSLPINRTFSHLIAVPENKVRKMLSFIRPGFKEHSYSGTFASSLFPIFNKTLDTNIRGEKRHCIACSFCEEVCPVKIVPHFLYNHIVNNLIDERLMNYGIFKCIECNLCSFVCPSKIQLAKSIKDGQEKLILMGCDSSQCIMPFFDLKGLKEYKGIK